VIDPAYVQVMARYNAWQNRQITVALDPVPTPVLTVDRRAFFGSIFATLNHILWGDRLWLNRFDPQYDPPHVGPDKHTELTPTFAVWSAERFKTDGQIAAWAKSLRSVDLKGDLNWYSSMVGKDLTMPFAQCVVQLFNHQTHHRGQVHAMMTAAGIEAAVTDIVLMPDEF
jgi:uncharacterized damage-inducible protein DinB